MVLGYLVSYVGKKLFTFNIIKRIYFKWIMVIFVKVVFEKKDEFFLGSCGAEFFGKDLLLKRCDRKD